MRLHAAVPALRIEPVGAAAARPAPGVLEALRGADVVVLPPSNPVVSIGTILQVPGIRDALVATPAPVVGVSPVIAGAPVRGMADACLAAIGVPTTAAAVAGLYADFLDGWLDRRGGRAPGARRAGGAPPPAAHELPAGHRRPRRGRPGPRPGPRPPGDRGVSGSLAGSLQVVGIPGIGEVVAGDDVAGLLVDALHAQRTSLGEGDVVAVSSKVVSKAAGLSAPAGEREAVVLRESRRLVAARRTPHGTARVVESAAGPVMAAAGVDASNVVGDVVLLLPADADAAARELRHRLKELTGATVGVVVTDTAGRPWRTGQTDFALGSAGLAVLDDLRGQEDTSGRPLSVTARAVVDEIAAAADLVKGKTSGVPAALIRGLGRPGAGDRGGGPRRPLAGAHRRGRLVPPRARRGRAGRAGGRGGGAPAGGARDARRAPAARGGGGLRRRTGRRRVGGPSRTTGRARRCAWTPRTTSPSGCSPSACWPRCGRSSSSGCSTARGPVLVRVVELPR